MIEKEELFHLRVNRRLFIIQRYFISRCRY